MLNNHYLHFIYEEVETEVRSLARGHRASQKLQKWPGLDLAKAKEVTKQFGSLSQPRHSRHMESINSLFCGCPVHCRKFSSSPGRHMPVATPPANSCSDSQKCHQTSPNVPWREKPTPGLGWFENHWMKGRACPQHPGNGMTGLGNYIWLAWCAWELGQFKEWQRVRLKGWARTKSQRGTTIRIWTLPGGQ